MHRPQIIPDEGTTPEATAIALQINQLNESIFESPGKYQFALRKLRKEVMSGTVELSPEDGYQPPSEEPIGAQPYQMLRNYFGNRLDRRSEFDGQTDSYIQGRPDIKALLESREGSRKRALKAGTSRAEYAPNEKAISSRDQIRMLRMGSYINLVAKFVKYERATDTVA